LLLDSHELLPVEDSVRAVPPNGDQSMPAVPPSLALPEADHESR